MPQIPVPLFLHLLRPRCCFVFRNATKIAYLEGAKTPGGPLTWVWAGGRMKDKGHGAPASGGGIPLGHAPPWPPALLYRVRARAGLKVHLADAGVQAEYSSFRSWPVLPHLGLCLWATTHPAVGGRRVVGGGGLLLAVWAPVFFSGEL